MKLLRSLLFVPGNRPKMLEKARSFTADWVILDLEDAVPPHEKDTGRVMVAEALRSGSYQAQVIVRVNGFNTGQTEQDLTAIVLPGVAAICLPKVESQDEVEQLEGLLGQLERQRGLDAPGIFLMIETALGVLNAYAIARASRRVSALCFGGEDFCRDMGAVRTKEGQEITFARGQMLLAAKAAGVAAIDTVYTDLNDLSGLQAETRSMRGLGYDGKLLIHPAQIEPVHLAFRPSAEEISYAQRVLDASAKASAQGAGVCIVDGKMIDAPIVVRARQTVALAKDQLAQT